MCRTVGVCPELHSEPRSSHILTDMYICLRRKSASAASASFHHRGPGKLKSFWGSCVPPWCLSYRVKRTGRPRGTPGAARGAPPGASRFGLAVASCGASEGACRGSGRMLRDAPSGSLVRRCVLLGGVVHPCPTESRTHDPKTSTPPLKADGFETGSHGFQMGSNGFQNDSNGFQMGSNGFQTSSNVFQPLPDTCSNRSGHAGYSYVYAPPATPSYVYVRVEARAGRRARRRYVEVRAQVRGGPGAGTWRSGRRYVEVRAQVRAAPGAGTCSSRRRYVQVLRRPAQRLCPLRSLHCMLFGM